MPEPIPPSGGKNDFLAARSSNAKETPKRIAFVKGRTAARVRKEEEELVMTVPHLVVREIIAFEIMVIVLALISLIFNAPLEWRANPEHTPNPAKAPWYFLGLQELLHYFPPIVAGVLLPTLAVVALIVIPYFKVNVRREGLWKENSGRTVAWLFGVVGLLSVFLLFYGVYAILVPTWIIAAMMLLPYLSKRETGMAGWLAQQSLAWWIMTWFVAVLVVLTVIGTLFRGPEWSWTWPWEGIY